MRLWTNEESGGEAAADPYPNTAALDLDPGGIHGIHVPLLPFGAPSPPRSASSSFPNLLLRRLELTLHSGLIRV